MRSHNMLLGAFPFFCYAAAATPYLPWMDPARPTEDRLQLFLKQLNRTQIYDMVQGDTVLDDNGTGVSSCVGHISSPMEGIVPAICYGDGPAGVGNKLDYVTTFPAPVLTAATWNLSTMYRYSQAISLEHKEKGRNVVLSPTINIIRSPLWARAAETFSEDQYLTAQLAVESVQGIQSQNVLACPKHLAAYNQDRNRFGDFPQFDAYNSIVDERVMHELYLPAFKAAIQEGKAGSVMCSYNKLNGEYTCQNEWLMGVLKGDWGFTGHVISDWYFADRSTVSAALAGLDISMPGGSLVADYGLPAFYGDLLVEAVNNGSVPFSRVEDMVARVWRYMFSLGVVDENYEGNSTGIVRSAAHLKVARDVAAEGQVLLMNKDNTLPLSPKKYKSIAVIGADATQLAQVTENHGGFPVDTTMVIITSIDSIRNRSELENITVTYSEGYPGTGVFETIPSYMFGDEGVNVTYWNTLDWSGPINQTVTMPNITSAVYPADMWVAWPDVFSSRYEAVFYPNTTGLYHFSLTGQGDALVWVNEQLIANMSGANFANTVQGIVNLTEAEPAAIRMDYSMGPSLSTGAFGISLGVVVGNETLYSDAVAKASEADVTIVFANDRFSEGADNGIGLRLPGDQDWLIEKVALASKKTVVVLNTNSAILMPWIQEVDAIIEGWYSGQEVGAALTSILFGDVNPSGKLPVTFPRSLEDLPIYVSGSNSSGELLDIHYDEGLLVGYKWYDAYNITPLFPFGHGLSYTTFTLSGLAINQIPGEMLISTNLTNTGKVVGQEVVQLYVSYPEAAREPPKQLKGFYKAEVQVGETVEVEMVVSEEDLQVWSTETSGWTLVGGEYTIMVGSSSRDISLRQTIMISG